MIDIHVHYFPARVFQAIWKFFETPSNDLWPIQTKLEGESLIQALRSYGVKRFTTLVYAHKPGMAASLNDFVAEAAQKHAELIPFGTLFAGDENSRDEARRIFEDLGFYGIKLHPFVSGEPVHDSRFFAAYDVMQSLGKVLVCHPGSGPNYKATDGAQHLAEVLRRYPKLKVVVAHCGAKEYGDYQILADQFENVYFDTAMNCVHEAQFSNNCPGASFFKKYQDRILFGSDFPNLNYPYQRQIESLKEMTQTSGLGQEVEAKIFEGNARKLLGLSS